MDHYVETGDFGNQLSIDSLLPPCLRKGGRSPLSPWLHRADATAEEEDGSEIEVDASFPLSRMGKV